MKKTVQQEIDCCDFCNDNEHHYDHCLGCGKTVCYECKKGCGVEYYHSLHCSGSGDGFYCHDCETKLEIRNTPMHLAYVAIENLRIESKSYNEGFRNRAKKAEKRLETLQKGSEQCQ